ncbi:MAG: tRNA-specific 2-thiouridylase [Candidatus Krumholzibacteriota bacterium]|nr:tRNA-specific 2-thiouridylase [Candidatus Krumholzibacteriota bacterium]
MPEPPDDSLRLPRALAGRRVLVAMSGGLDSSVAALLLQRAGAEVVGVTFRNFFRAGETDCDGAGRDEDPACLAGAVCARLGVTHRAVDESLLFGRRVVEPFLAGYRAGRTPNPCVRCNAALRFPRLAALADEWECRHVATGHYARIARIDRTAPPRVEGSCLRVESWDTYLAAAVDRDKDQSYFLAGVPPRTYPRLIFPLGGITKARARALAREAGLEVHERPESQDACFLAGRSLGEYLAAAGALHPGPVVGPGGEVLGRHDGYELFTVGQRRGLGVAAGEPLYVAAIETATATVRLGREADLRARRIRCREAWAAPSPWEGEGVWPERVAYGPFASEPAPDDDDDTAPPVLRARIRYRGRPLMVSRHALAGTTLTVDLAEPAIAPAPGQSLVLYHGDLVIGHGIIDSAGAGDDADREQGDDRLRCLPD